MCQEYREPDEALLTMNEESPLSREFNDVLLVALDLFLWKGVDSSLHLWDRIPVDVMVSHPGMSMLDIFQMFFFTSIWIFTHQVFPLPALIVVFTNGTRFVKILLEANVQKSRKVATMS